MVGNNMSDSETRAAPQVPAEAADEAAPAPAAPAVAARAEPRPAPPAALPAAQPLPAPAATPNAPTPGPWPTPLLDPAAFRSDDPEMRLRDMLAFAMAADSGGAAPDITGLRQKAEGELNAFAFRLLHNRVDEIRREAMQEQIAGMRPTLSFATLVAANAVALVAAGLIGALLWVLLTGLGGH
jgi:hypothetical protein